ncbi:MAG: MmcQ/YjbR family DNA-binding protein [Rhizobiales bacterium]|nr:MmcQ/YjbR family DNA-binding protein [Hyphomicrobiales bacterium]
MHPEIPTRILSRLRPICLALPDAREEVAWTGIRWRIRAKTFAHVLMIDGGWPPAYAKAAGTDGPACVLTFRSTLAAIDSGAFREPPFFKPVWWPDIAGMTLGNRVDWDDVSKLVQASYRMLAPRNGNPAGRRRKPISPSASSR